MLELGEYHKMIIDRDVSPGLYLRDAEENEVLLPGKYAPEGFQLEDEIEVFVYLDNEERPVATTLKPYILKNGFAYLECTSVTKIGAFVDWGLDKELFVPFSNQVTPMKEGSWYLVYMYLDERTNRLLGSSKFKVWFIKTRFLKISESATDYRDISSACVKIKRSMFCFSQKVIKA